MATLVTRISELATAIAAELKSHKLLINGNAANLSALNTTVKTDLVSALNELYALVQSAGTTEINDAVTVTNKTWSSSKIVSVVNAATAALINSAPGALDTLNELAAALGNDPNFAASVNTALGNRVRFDAAQTLTAPQQLQARANIGAQSAAEIGVADTDFVAIFSAGLA